VLAWSAVLHLEAPQERTAAEMRLKKSSFFNFFQSVSFLMTLKNCSSTRSFSVSGIPPTSAPHVLSLVPRHWPQGCPSLRFSRTVLDTHTGLLEDMKQRVIGGSHHLARTFSFAAHLAIAFTCSPRTQRGNKIVSDNCAAHLRQT
jgi:hypothetical protein